MMMVYKINEISYSYQIIAPPPPRHSGHKKLSDTGAYISPQANSEICFTRQYRCTYQISSQRSEKMEGCGY